MNSRIFHSVNAGLCFETESVNIILDGIHGGKSVGMSDVPIQVVDWVIRTQKKTLLLFTHLHEDHYHQGLVQQILSDNPNTELFSPETVGEALEEEMYTAGYAEFDYYGIKIGIVPTLHQGEKFRKIKHFSYLIDMGDKSCFVAGDGILGQQEWILLQNQGKHSFDFVFCNTFHLSSKVSVAFVKAMAPVQVALYHLPRESDDKYNYWMLAQNNQRQYPAGMPVLQRLKHMSWISWNGIKEDDR